MCVCVCVCGPAASPAMRGSTPLDVAASSVMDNNGLALELEEPDLEKVGRSHPASAPHHLVDTPGTS